MQRADDLVCSVNSSVTVNVISATLWSTVAHVFVSSELILTLSYNLTDCTLNSILLLYDYVFSQSST